MNEPTPVSPGRDSTPLPRSSPSWRAALLDVSFWADWASVVGLAGLVIIFGISQPVFLSVANLQALLLAAAILIVIATGQTFVVATSGIDLSLAATIMFGAVVLGCVYTAGWGILAACLLTVAVTCLIGFLNGVIITLGRIPDFVVTLGTLSAITGA